MFSVREAFSALSSARLFGDGATLVTGVGTDTRKVSPGELFIALRGEQFDANDFAPAAQQAGARAVLVERLTPGLTPPVIQAPDSRVALGEIARYWRARFDLPVIAVAGSNGKTTVKEMIAAILGEHCGVERRLATQGNLNNDVGVPLTVFRLGPQHRAAVLELGMNHIGEIAWLAEIARPTVALVNNAQREHQEFMSSVEATAYENGAVLTGLGADGIAVFPGDDAHTSIWRSLSGARRRIEFGLSSDLEVFADPLARPEGFVLHVGSESMAVNLAISGQHNVRNALAAAACCHAIGIPVETVVRGLQLFQPVKGRLVSHRLPAGATLIDDSYNANPDSVRAAIDVLAARPSPRVLVLGDMGEVGAQGPQYHDEVGDYARERGVDHLLALGEATRNTVARFGQSGEHFGELDALASRARMLANGEATVLVKGSRFMRMERVVAQLMAQAH